MKVGHRVRRGVQHPPEFPAAGPDPDHGRRQRGVGDRHVVQAEVPAGDRAAGLGLARHGLIANDQHPGGQAGDDRLQGLDAVHHDRSRGAALHRPLGEAMDVRVIPVEAGRLVAGNGHVIGERLAGVDAGMDDIVAVAGRHDRCAVEVKVHRRCVGHGVAADRRSEAHHHPVGQDIGRRRGLVGQGDVERITGSDVEGGRFEAVGGDKAEQRPAVAIDRRDIVETQGQPAVAAVQIGGRLRRSARPRPPTTRRGLGSSPGRRRRDGRGMMPADRRRGGVASERGRSEQPQKCQGRAIAWSVHDPRRGVSGSGRTYSRPPPGRIVKIARHSAGSLGGRDGPEVFSTCARLRRPDARLRSQNSPDRSDG